MENQAHQATNIARLGLHNDCFLASADDFGTYWDYGSDTNIPSNQIGDLKPYAAATGKYTAIGGETCSDGFSPQNDCMGQALTDMAALQYTYLNAFYNNEVNNDWETDGCMDEIKQKLGYRFVLKDGTYPLTADAGSSLNFSINLENVGFAAPFNERKLHLILRHTASSKFYKLDFSGTNLDTRFWHTGAIALSGTAQLPTNMPNGNYELLLHIYDPSANNRIANRPEYSIQLANTGTWEATTGYNNLNHTLTVNSPFSVTCNAISIDGTFGDWENVDNISTDGTGGLTRLSVTDDETNIYIYTGTTIDANYQLFLDTDNDSNGTGEYTGGLWSATGINYMLENGSLYEYTGSGSNWSWNKIADVTPQKQPSGIEVAFAKSQFANLATTINIGFRHLNASWTEVGRIPNTTIAANYTATPNLVCHCNENDIVVSNGIATSTSYETQGTIESTENLTGNISVVYDAQNSIVLKPGFSIANGTNFHAFIDGCEVAATFSSSTVAVQRESVTPQNKITTYPQPINFRGFPNPFQNEISIEYELPAKRQLTIFVVDIFGRVLQQPIVSQWQDQGFHQLKIATHHLPVGVYSIVLESRDTFTIYDQQMLKVVKP